MAYSLGQNDTGSKPLKINVLYSPEHLIWFVYKFQEK